jgi:aspartyl-tRNA(Asn)/glutamyl-tRNA(Gln) amidotransferase subunit C
MSEAGSPGALGRAAPPGALGRAEVAHVARLARLVLTDEELDRFTGQLAQVLEHAADVAALDLTGVAPTAHPLPVANVLRSDVARPGLDRREVLAAAPEVEDDRFRVPRIVGHER